jgi:hypothetical protein
MPDIPSQSGAELAKAELAKINAAIAVQEALRGIMPDAQLELMLSTFLRAARRHWT